MRILLLNLGMESIREVKQALSGQGYEITAERNLTVDKILALSPEILITEATPSDLSCCGVISQIKASPALPTLRIVMIVHGGALERARALELGAEDVASFPFEPLEFLAKIRTQFRERQPELELEAKLKDALQREHLAEVAVEALTGGTNPKQRFGLILAVFGLSAAAILAAFVTVISNRHCASLGANDVSGTHESLKEQTEEIHKTMAAADGTDGESLKKQLQETQNRLDRLENEGRVAETIVHTYGPSVCLLHVVVEFRDKDSGQLIRISTDATGKPLVDDKGWCLSKPREPGRRCSLTYLALAFS
jgi:CheY-like chemotaxis protein